MVWNASLPSNTTTVLSTEAALADGSISAAGVEVDNATDLETVGYIEVLGTWTVAPNAVAPRLDIYLTVAADGTNHSSPPITGGTDQDHMRAISIPARSVTSEQRLFSAPFSVPPGKLRHYVDNQTGQSLNSNYVVKFHNVSN